MQQWIPLNFGWLFKRGFEEKDRAGAQGAADFEAVDLPHTNRVLPFNYIDEADYQFVACYARQFRLPAGAAGRDVLAYFEGVMLEAQVFCNGQPVCVHRGGYTPFLADLTPAVDPQGENWLVVRVDSTERPDIPPYGNVVDYLTYGGIYREVYLGVADRTRITGVWPSTPGCLAEKKRLCVAAELRAAAPGPAQLTLALLDGSKKPVACTEKQIELCAGEQRVEIALDGLEGIALWQLDAPALYEAELTLKTGAATDRACRRLGFRESRFTPEGYYLNGQKIKLVGLNRHQAYPYVGYAMPRRVQRRDAELLKEQAGVNLVRTSHYPQSRHFLDRCDELGLLVLEEIPGWQHIGDAAWQALALEDVEAMITRDFSHPSVILWGVRINESQDAHDFYSRTNALARRLDPTRQTGGTRYIQNSELLEDVYTYNDFTYTGTGGVFRAQKATTGLEREVPLLVTECVGHTYPTKSFDQESRRVEHAMRHLRSIDEALARPDLAGMVGWCAFDYNSHGCFGSGDKVCYHGVFDMYRNPKYAAYAYASQKNPAQGPVMEPVTVAARGERDGGGIVPFAVLTNCDFVRVYKNGVLVDDFYPDRAHFTHLPHPPVIVSHLLEQSVELGFTPEDMRAFKAFLTGQSIAGQLPNIDEASLAYLKELAEKYGLPVRRLYSAVVKMGGGWGDAENDFLLEGYFGGKPVCRKRIGERKSFGGLRLLPDDTRLTAAGATYEATRIAVCAVDSFGAPLPFTQECVEIQVFGPARLLGPERFPLPGGAAACWIRTTGQKGRVTVRAQGVWAAAECVVEVEE